MLIFGAPRPNRCAICILNDRLYWFAKHCSMPMKVCGQRRWSRSVAYTFPTPLTHSHVCTVSRRMPACNVRASNLSARSPVLKRPSFWLGCCVKVMGLCATQLLRRSAPSITPTRCQFCASMRRLKTARRCATCWQRWSVDSHKNSKQQQNLSQRGMFPGPYANQNCNPHVLVCRGRGRYRFCHKSCARKFGL